MLGALAAIACCNEVSDLDFNGGLQIGDSAVDVTVTRARQQQGAGSGDLVGRVRQALQEAVHPGSSSLFLNGRGSGAGGGGASGQEAIPFPVISPYYPLTAARAPVTGLTAFPKKGYYFNGGSKVTFNGNGNDPSAQIPTEQQSLGFADPIRDTPIGIGLKTDGFSPLGMKWEGIIGQAIQTAPGIISASRGQPYYDPAQNINPQLIPRYPGAESAYTYPGSGGAAEGVGAGVGRAADTLGDTVGRFVAEHPYLVIGGGAALFLLFMNPPRRR